MSEEKLTAPNKTRQYVMAALAIAFLLLVGFGLRNRTALQPAVGTMAPDLELAFYDGYAWENQPTATLSDMQGDVVVLNFWASWCAPCRLEAEELEAVWRTYADQGVVFVGVAWSDTDTKAHEYMQEYDISYPNAPDLQLQAQKVYRFKQVPETYVIRPDGEIAHFHQGPLTAEQLSAMIAETLGQ